MVTYILCTWAANMTDRWDEPYVGVFTSEQAARDHLKALSPGNGDGRWFIEKHVINEPELQEAIDGGTEVTDAS